MKTFLLLLLSSIAASAQAQEGTRECQHPKFGLNNSDEVCVIVTRGPKSDLLRLETDVASYDPDSPILSRQSVGKTICKLFGYRGSLLLSMTYRKAEQGGFIGGGAILGGGSKKISVVDTIRCEGKL